MGKVHIDNYIGKKLHLIGVGGCSMNGLAQILAKRGYLVTGSDRNESPFTKRLGELGIPVTIGHDPKNVEGADLVVYSAAIKKENPERAQAAQLSIPELERSVVLGQLSGQYGNVVGIAGCHGKTTITSMLALISEKANLDATVHVGGFVDFLQGGTRIGNSSTFITEACEYVESFLELSPTCIVVNNIDDDHLDYFRDIEHIYQAFYKFAALMPADGVLFGSVDDPRVVRLIAESGKTAVTYGLTGGDYTAKGIETFADGGTAFTAYYKGSPLMHVNLGVPGHHNVLNALAAIAVSHHLGANTDSVAAALGEYRLTRRRFEYYGEKDGVRIYHDYAHHPAEIAACLQAARSVTQGKLWVVFQCNSYTRAKTLFCENVTCFKDADEVLVPDIYPGREVDTGLVHARDMVAAIALEGTDAKYIPTFEEIDLYLRSNWNAGDLVVTLGSGDVYIQTRVFLRN